MRQSRRRLDEHVVTGSAPLRVNPWRPPWVTPRKGGLLRAFGPLTNQGRHGCLCSASSRVVSRRVGSAVGWGGRGPAHRPDSATVLRKGNAGQSVEPPCHLRQWSTPASRSGASTSSKRCHATVASGGGHGCGTGGPVAAAVHLATATFRQVLLR